MARPAATAALPEAIERALPLIRPELRPEHPSAPKGWLDLIGAEDQPLPEGFAPRMMRTTLVPAVYERYWRPMWGRLLKGPLGPSMTDEHRIARLLMALSPGDGVLDVACGPGNFTRDFARTVGPTGLAVGIDASTTMLARAVSDTEEQNVAYIRGDAVELPFRDESFDGVCCFAALHMFDDPWTALDDFHRVLTRGGRVAILTSARTRTPPLRTLDSILGARSGQRMFEQGEITSALAERGFVDLRQRIAGFGQFVGARKA